MEGSDGNVLGSFTTSRREARRDHAGSLVRLLRCGIVRRRRRARSLPHKRCRLEIVASAESRHREANLVLPGQVLRYAGSLCFLDRFELPSGTRVGLWHLVGFKLRLVSDTTGPVPSEDAILSRAPEMSALPG